MIYGKQKKETMSHAREILLSYVEVWVLKL